MNETSGGTFSRYLWLVCLFGWFGIYGCYIPKHIQPGKPFVFKNNIELTANVSKSEKKSLTRDLSQQLDDSLAPQVKDLLFIWHTILSPAVYDSLYAGNSLQFMKLYMNNQGFFSPQASYAYHIDTVKANRKNKTQYRVTTTFYVDAGARTLLDSIVTDLKDPTLQRLADSSKKSTLLVRNDPYSSDKLQGEMNRLLSIYKNYGYYALTQDAFQVTLDTTNPILINPVLDPLERIQRFEAQTNKQKNPTTDVYITLRPDLDSSLLKRYYVRQVFFYPDFQNTRDNKKVPLTGVVMDSIVLRYRQLKFKPSFLLRSNFLQPGDLYKQDNYNKTLNTFNFLNVWQVPIIQAREVKDTAAQAPPQSDSTKRTAPDSTRSVATGSRRSGVADSSRSAAGSGAIADSARSAVAGSGRSGVADSSHSVAGSGAIADSTRSATAGSGRSGVADSSRSVADSTGSGATATAGVTDSAGHRITHEDTLTNEALLAGGVPRTDTGYISRINTSYDAYASRLRDSVGLLDFYYLLTPAKKQSFNSSFEINYSDDNNNPVAIASGNVFGTAVGFGLTNRNVGKEAINMTNTINGGLEVNPRFNWALAEVNVGYTNTFTIPRFITPFRSINRDRLLAEQTVISSNATYVESIGYFNLNSFNFKYGYQWKTSPNVIWSYNPISVEYTYLYNITDAFESALQSNPYLAYSYTNALIMAQNVDLLYSFANHRHPNRTSSIRANLETSGLISGIIKNSSDNRLFPQLKEYVRPSVEYKHEIKYPNNNSWDFRVFAGVGIPLGGDSTLPFFKQFVGGGPNSMRAWEFRSLGPGATHLAPYSQFIFNDRFGDIQLEGNIEYRYNIAEIIPNSMFLKGAIFTDIGNIWDFRKQHIYNGTVPAYDSAHLDISHFYQELAVGAGVGFRLDFNYFILRFDFGFRFKKPDEPVNDGWQFPDINLAHIFGRSLDNKEWRYNNYNFSFGIGYSF